MAHVFRGPKVLDPGSCFQRLRIFGFWLMFSEDQGSGSGLMFSEDLEFLDLGLFSEDQGFFGLWLMFSKDQWFRILAHVFRGLGFWGLAHVFRGPRVFLGFGSCFQRTKDFGSWLMFSEA